MGVGENKNSTFFHSCPQAANHETLLMDPCFCIVICRGQLGSTSPCSLHVHQTLLAFTLHAYFWKVWLILPYYNSSVMFRAWLSLLVVVI